MARYVNFDEVKARVSMDMVLTHYQLLTDRTKRQGDEVILHCCFHDDTTPSLKVNTATNRFHCFGCDAGGGDSIAFVVLKEDIDTGDPDRDRRDAALLLQQWFPLDAPRSSASRRRGRKPARDRRRAGKQTAEADAAPASPAAELSTEGAEPARDENAAPPNPPLTFSLKDLDPAHPYLAEHRGFTAETISAFGAGYHAGKGIMQNRVVVPIHNLVGELVAYIGRWPTPVVPDSEDKYRLPPKFQKSLVLFNLHRAQEHAGEGLIVVEGPFDVMAFWQRGRKNVVAVLGSTLSAAQERLIVSTVGPRGRVLIAFDPDDAGRKGMAEAAARLASQVFVRTLELKTG